MHKLAIKKRFDAASSTYEGVSFIQKECAKILVQDVEETSINSILDLGTGTGSVAEELVKRFGNASYTLNDISEQMLNVAKAKFANNSNFNYQLGDFEGLSFDYNDLVISNLAFQWAQDFESAIRKFYENSGVLAFSTLIDGTFDEWEKILKVGSLNNYPSLVGFIEFLSSLNPAGISYSTKKFSIRFPDAITFMKYLKSLGASQCDKYIPFGNLREIIKHNTEEFEVTYHVFFCVLRRS